MRRIRNLRGKGIIMRRSAFALSLAFVCSAPGAWAGPQCSALIEQGCACAIDIASANGAPVATLREIQGDVLKSAMGEYTPVSSPTGLNVGDGVLTKANGRAVVSADPACNLALGPQTSVVIGQTDGCACIAVVGDWQAATGATGDDGDGGGGGGGLAALFAAGGLAAFLALHQASNPVSP